MNIAELGGAQFQPGQSCCHAGQITTLGALHDQQHLTDLTLLSDDGTNQLLAEVQRFD